MEELPILLLLATRPGEGDPRAVEVLRAAAAEGPAGVLPTRQQTRRGIALRASRLPGARS
ncbi:MAG: hypothetical protein FJW96_16700 [Actinobacteria bacterium]|nr:hypothetical protein [Actinomycetota bacterium]